MAVIPETIKNTKNNIKLEIVKENNNTNEIVNKNNDIIYEEKIKKIKIKLCSCCVFMGIMFIPVIVYFIAFLIGPRMVISSKLPEIGKINWFDIFILIPLVNILEFISYICCIIIGILFISLIIMIIVAIFNCVFKHVPILLNGKI